MPYIDPDRRRHLDPGIHILTTELDLVKGNAADLGYIIAKLFACYIDGNHTSHQHYIDLLGVLEGTKLEMYRGSLGLYRERRRGE